MKKILINGLLYVEVEEMDMDMEDDENLYYKNVTNSDGSYTQYLMKGDNCCGFHTYTKEQIEGIRKLEQKREYEIWYGEYNKNKENMSVDKFTPDYSEGWEERLRAKLEKETPDGIYEFDVGGSKMMTGKGGAIEIEIQMRKEFLKSQNMSADKEPNLTEGHSDIEIEKQRIWEKHNKYEGAVKGYKKERHKPTNLTPPKKKRKK